MGSCGSATKQSISEPASAPSQSPRCPTDSPPRGLLSRAQLIAHNPGTRRIQDVYTIDTRKLGEGSYGSVCKGIHNDTGAIRAIKRMAKSKVPDIEVFMKEIAILKEMDHPSIIKLYETYEDHHNIYLAMELCVGGTLFDRIVDEGHLSEVEAATVMQQILRAVFYMHQKSVCHRDLKPENILFSSTSSILKNELKLTDFGLSSRLLEGRALTRAGTPLFVAPEVLDSKFDHMCDNWSVGVTMYILLSGSPPFNGRNNREVLSKVQEGKLVFDPMDWKGISKDAKDLIQSLVTVDPKFRFTAEQALNHRWIQHRAPRTADVPLDGGFVDRLRSFRSRSRFAKAALHAIAAELSEAQIKSLRAMFISLDRNGDGLLTFGEVAEGLQRAGLPVPPSDLEDILDGIDLDGSGVIDYTEFLAGNLERGHLVQENACFSAFRAFDLDGDGRISADELRKVLYSGSVADELDAEATCDVFEEVDENGDGAIDFNEFMAMVLGESGGHRYASRGRSRSQGRNASPFSKSRSVTRRDSH